MWRTKRILANVLLVAISVAVTLLLAEFIVRWAFRDVTTTADYGSHFAVEWRRGLQLNGAGFREREWPEHKPDGVLRVALVGDSFAFGQGIPRAGRLSEQLEQRLNAGREQVTRFEWWNFGRPGAETVDQVSILHEYVLPIEPDLVVLQWFENDVEGSDTSGRPRPARLVPSDTIEGLLRRRSALFYLLRNQWHDLQRRWGWVATREDYMRRRFEDPASADSIAAHRALGEFIAGCRDAGIPVAIVLYPPLGRPHLGFLHRRVMQQCAEESIPCIDLAPVFDEVEDKSTLWANRLDSHPSERANEIATSVVMDRWGTGWIVLADEAGERPGDAAPAPR